METVLVSSLWEALRFLLVYVVLFVVVSGIVVGIFARVHGAEHPWKRFLRRRRQHREAPEGAGRWEVESGELVLPPERQGWRT